MKVLRNQVRSTLKAKYTFSVTSRLILIRNKFLHFIFLIKKRDRSAGLQPPHPTVNICLTEQSFFENVSLKTCCALLAH